MASFQPSGRSRLGRLLGVRVAATGSYVPSEVVTNEDLAALGCDSEWIVRRTGILQRRKAAAHEASSDLAFAAAMQCLQAAEVSPEDLDLILVATITPDHPTPSTACHLQRRLGALAPAMDLNAACAGFMYALVTGAQFVHSGSASRVLVVGTDVMSRTIDPRDVKTFPLFGDGAGAALLVPDRPEGAGLLAYTWVPKVAAAKCCASQRVAAVRCYRPKLGTMASSICGWMDVKCSSGPFARLKTA